MHACVCVGGGGGGVVFHLGSSFFICFFRQVAAIVFYSLKASVFLCGDEGEGTEAFLVKNVERSLEPRQANLELIAYASSEGSVEPAHPRSLARTSAARSYKQ